MRISVTGLISRCTVKKALLSYRKISCKSDNVNRECRANKNKLVFLKYELLDTYLIYLDVRWILNLSYTRKPVVKHAPCAATLNSCFLEGERRERKRNKKGGRERKRREGEPFYARKERPSQYDGSGKIPERATFCVICIAYFGVIDRISRFYFLPSPSRE